MLISELIVRHIGPEGALHERGIRLNETQLPPGSRVHHEGSSVVSPVADDLLVVVASVGPGLPEQVDTDLPVGVTVVFLFEAQVTDLPVDRVLAALAVAKLQVVEAVVVSGTSEATVAVVAKRTDDVVVPQPHLAHHLEPGNHESPAVLRRVLGEHALDGLVHPASERALLVQLEKCEVRLSGMTKELEQLHQDNESLTGDLDMTRKKLQSTRSSTSFKVASRMARAARTPGRMVRRLGRGTSRG